MRSTAVLLGAALLGALAGCGSREETDKLVRSYKELLHEQTEAQEKALTVLEGVKDQASMTAALEQLKEPYLRLDRTAAALKNLGPPSVEIQRRLGEDMTRAQETAQGVYLECRRIHDLPGGKEFLDALKHLNKKRPARPNAE